MTRLAPLPTERRGRSRPLAGVAPVALLLLGWALLAAAAGLALATLATPAHPIGWALLVPAAAALGLAALVGLRTAVLLVAARRAPRAGTPLPASGDDPARVAILYPVADDFRADVVRRSARQTHPGTRTIVLDDSSEPAVRRRIDALVAEGGVEVHRRAARQGAKAGNLNAWLAAHGHEVEHVVVLDADQEAEPDLVARALARARQDPAIAVVQGAVRSRTGATAFARDFAPLFDRHARWQLAARQALGLDAFCGRGALLEVAAVRACGGFPELVMEDTALTIELARRGRRIVAAPEAVSFEDAPIDHAAFAVQFGKFTEGAVQLLAGSAGAARDALLPVRRRLDLLLELLMPVAAAVVPTVLFAFAVAAAATGAPPFPWQLGLVLGALGMLPLLPAIRDRALERSPLRALAFAFRASMLYASVGVVAARALAHVAVSGRARFRITPKAVAGGDGAQAVLRRAPEVLAAVAAVLLATALAGAPAAAMPFIGIAAAALAFGLRDAWASAGAPVAAVRAEPADA